MTSAPLLRASDLACFALWAATYLLILRRGFLDRASGMPLGALAPAIAWEAIFGVLRPTRDLPPFAVPAWFALDALLLVQFFRHGLARQRGRAGAGWFVARTAAVLAGAFAIEYAATLDAHDADGVVSGFAVNVVMSLAFLAMLERREDLRGQSMGVALTKLGGTAATVPHALAMHGALRSLRTFMVLSLACDVAYAVLLHRAFRRTRER